uniref:Uncharacterized protein n=1 Tax=Arundo donax TaxID=35708 RepID=A0A0A8ZIU0_ARUDO
MQHFMSFIFLACFMQGRCDAVSFAAPLCENVCIKNAGNRCTLWS